MSYAIGDFSYNCSKFWKTSIYAPSLPTRVKGTLEQKKTMRVEYCSPKIFLSVEDIGCQFLNFYTPCCHWQRIPIFQNWNENNYMKIRRNWKLLLGVSIRARTSHSRKKTGIKKSRWNVPLNDYIQNAYKNGSLFLAHIVFNKRLTKNAIFIFVARTYKPLRANIILCGSPVNYLKTQGNVFRI
jgi:hypothetical protein